MEMWKLMFPIVAFMSACAAPSGGPGGSCSLQAERSASQAQIESAVAAAMRNPPSDVCGVDPVQVEEPGWYRMPDGRAAYRAVVDFQSGELQVQFAVIAQEELK